MIQERVAGTDHTLYKELRELVASAEYTPQSELETKALEWATRAHEGQFRYDGQPYVTHCTSTAFILKNIFGIKDQRTLAGGLLHDTVEDTNLTLEEIRAEFGDEVADLVDGVSKFKSEDGVSTTEQEFKYRKKLLGTSEIPSKVLLIKLADRLHNMLTLNNVPLHKRAVTAQETLDIYAPMAEALGLWDVKIWLEDLSFQYINPEEYKSMVNQVESDPRRDPVYMDLWKNKLEDLLSSNSYYGSVEIRKAGYWEIHQKLRRATRRAESSSLSDINDVISVRVILADPTQVYSFLEVVHRTFGTDIDHTRLDIFDQSNTPPNGYRALQVTTRTPEGALEVALVTDSWEEQNRWGVADELRSERNHLPSLVGVFTPDGDLKFLPKRAKIRDYAYMVNQLLGASAECALIDGQEVDLDREIPNACICEIIPGPPRRAPEVTNEQYQLLLPSTKAAIDKQRRLSKRDELAIEGRQMIADLLAKNGLLSLEDLGDKIRQILYGNNCSSMEEAYARIAQGNLTLATISDWVEKQSQAFKAERQCTTILVSDHDRPGVISEISSLVLQFGGNISDMGLSFNSDHTTFRMRLVVNNLDPSKERRIRAIIMNENRYQFGVVI